jgi:hypothetical protein
LSFSIISASFPCLRTFLWAFMSRGECRCRGAKQ